MLLREKLRVLNSLMMWDHLAGSGVYGKIISVSAAHFIVGFLSFAWCIDVTQLVLEFFFEGNCSVCNCRSSVSMCLVFHLDLEPYFFFS